MLRTFDVVLIVIMIAAAAVTYHVKQRAEQKEMAIAEIRHRIGQEEDNIKLLRAEWSLLTEPSRLQKLTDLYHDQLGLEPLDPKQMTTFQDLPVRPAAVPGTSSADQAAQPDNVMTGSVRN
jgi:hypothetical protein